MFIIYNSFDNDIYKINSMGYTKSINLTKFGPAKRNNYIIHYVLSGKGYFNGNPVTEGQGFLITPQMYEVYFSSEENPWEFLWIIFENDDSIAKIFDGYNANTETNIFKYNNFSELFKAKNFIISNADKFFRSSELYEKFLHIFNNHNVNEKSKELSKINYYDYSVKYINANLFRKITVNELVRILGISQPYLYNIFKDKIGISPKQYINEQKILKAKEMLRTTSMSIEEIANSIGIDDNITFSKFFKKYVGTSPTEYKKMYL